jgi:ribose transport system substrate-binding protein
MLPSAFGRRYYVRVTRRFCTLLLILAAAASVPACGRGTNRNPGKPVIGVTLLTETHTFYKELEAGLRDEAAKRNFDLIVVACEMDPAKQAAQLEDFVAQRVNAILAAPCDSDAIGPHLAGPEQAGIPVFTVDIAARSGKVVSHIASDNVQGGRLAAEALAGFMGDHGKVLIIDHPTVASVQDRLRGFDEELKKHPSVTVVARPSADGQRARAMAIMEDMLQANRDITGVFGINDDSALGALSVIEAAGRKDISIVGFDATDEARAAIRRGSALKADVVQHPKEMGHKAIEVIARYLAGEQVPPVVPIQVGLFK